MRQIGCAIAPMISLSDAELQIVLDASRHIDPRERGQFLRAVSAKSVIASLKAHWFRRLSEQANI